MLLREIQPRPGLPTVHAATLSPHMPAEAERQQAMRSGDNVLVIRCHRNSRPGAAALGNTGGWITWVQLRQIGRMIS